RARREHVVRGEPRERDPARRAEDQGCGEEGPLPGERLKAMATPIQMPALSPTMKEGKITKWLKKEGDKVSSGEAVAECETDKSNLEIEAYEDGYLIKIAVKEGETAPVGATIGMIGEK